MRRYGPSPYASLRHVCVTDQYRSGQSCATILVRPVQSDYPSLPRATSLHDLCQCDGTVQPVQSKATTRDGSIPRDNPDYPRRVKSTRQANTSQAHATLHFATCYLCPLRRFTSRHFATARRYGSAHVSATSPALVTHVGSRPPATELDND